MRGNPVIEAMAYVVVADDVGQVTHNNAISIGHFPLCSDIECSWYIKIRTPDPEDQELLLKPIQKLLPSLEIIHRSTFDIVCRVTALRQADTILEPKPKSKTVEEIEDELKEKFEDLEQDIQDRMVLYAGRNGKNGKDGNDGAPGRDGRDGKDIDATETSIGALKDVDLEYYIPLKRGQAIMFDGERFTNLFIPQIHSISAGGGGTVVTATGANVITSDVKPITREDNSPLQDGDQWWNSMTGTSFVYYVDADSSQWVQSAGDGGGAGVNSLNDLDDVDIDPALLARDQGLLYDGTNWTVGSPPVLIEATNTTGLPILKATPVCVTGTAPSGKPEIGPASSTDPTGKPAIGLADRDIGAGEEGYVLVSGKLFQTDTSSYVDGDALYLSSTAGALTATRPLSATEKVQKVGLVTRVHPTVGTILVIGAGRANDVNNELIALTGVGLNAADLGTFGGETISDNSDIKTALQELETGLETLSIDDLTDVDTTTNDPAAGQSLLWDADNNQWVPGTPQISTGTEVTTLLLLNFDTDANFDSVVDSTNMTTTYPSTDAKFGDRGATFSRPNADYLSGTWLTNVADEKFTLEFHIKTTDTDYVSSIGRHVFAPASGTNVSNGFQIFRDPEGGTAKSPHSDNAQGALMLNTDATASGYLCSTRTVNIADGQFHFVVFQHEGNAVYSCYVDGILQERRTYGGGAVNFANNGGYLIGGRADANAESYFTGTLDALALYVADIKFTGNTGGGGNEPPGQENTFDGAVLNDLIDVDTQASLPQDGSALVYDNTDGKWKPGDVVKPTDSIDILADVDITTTPPVANQAIVWSPGSPGKFVPGKPVPGDFIPGSSNDPNFNDVILQIPYYVDEFDDSNTAAAIVNTLGTPISSTATPYIGFDSYFFNGSSRYTYENLSSALNLGTDDFTIEAEILLSSSSSAQDPFAMIHGAPGNPGFWAITVAGPTSTTSTPGSMRFFYYDGGNKFLDSATLMVRDTWYNITIQRTGTDIDLYINGALESSVTTSTTLDLNQAGNFAVGANRAWPQSVATGNWWLGNVQGIRVTKGLRRYSSNFTPSALAAAVPNSFVEVIDSIDVLSDVDTSTVAPTDGQALIWDNANSQWKPGDVATIYRTTQSVTTSSIADGAAEDVTLANVGYAGQFIAITTDRAAWVTIYTDTASRTADAGRAETIDPAPGSGVLTEVITTGAETIRVTPAVGYFNDETIPAAELYLKVVNKSGSTSTVQVDAKVTVLEN